MLRAQPQNLRGFFSPSTELSVAFEISTLLLRCDRFADATPDAVPAQLRLLPRFAAPAVIQPNALIDPSFSSQTENLRDKGRQSWWARDKHMNSNCRTVKQCIDLGLLSS